MNIEKNFFYYIIAVTFVLLALYFCKPAVRNHSRGDERTRQQITTAGDINKQIQSGIKQSETTAGSITTEIERSQTAVSTAATTVGRIEEDISNAGRLNRECQSILENVRRRSESGAEEN